MPFSVPLLFCGKLGVRACPVRLSARGRLGLQEYTFLALFQDEHGSFLQMVMFQYLPRQTHSPGITDTDQLGVHVIIVITPFPIGQASPKGAPVHSEEFLDDSRFDWYNRDFLELMARRWQLDSVRSCADIGCGLGHWHRTLMEFLPALEDLHAIDFEPGWVAAMEEQRQAYAARNLALHPLRANAASLPVPDSSFDLVTCQTLLIHVPDIPRVLQEFFRVTRTGGRVAVAEPDNMCSALCMDADDEALGMKHVLRKVRFEVGYALGKYRRGLGKSFAVQTLPHLLYQAGFRDIQVHLSDKVSSGTGLHDPEGYRDTRDSLFGPSLHFLEAVPRGRRIHARYWKTLAAWYRRKARPEARERLECQPSVMYLVSGVKPEQGDSHAVSGHQPSDR